MRPKLHVTEISPVSALLKRIGKLHDRGQLVRTGEQPAGSCPLCTVHEKKYSCGPIPKFSSRWGVFSPMDSCFSCTTMSYTCFLFRTIYTNVFRKRSTYLNKAHENSLLCSTFKKLPLDNIPFAWLKDGVKRKERK